MGRFGRGMASRLAPTMPNISGQGFKAPAGEKVGGSNVENGLKKKKKFSSPLMKAFGK